MKTFHHHLTIKTLVTNIKVLFWCFSLRLNCFSVFCAVEMETPPWPFPHFLTDGGRLPRSGLDPPWARRDNYMEDGSDMQYNQQGRPHDIKFVFCAFGLISWFPASVEIDMSRSVVVVQEYKLLLRRKYAMIFWTKYSPKSTLFAFHAVCCC